MAVESDKFFTEAEEGLQADISRAKKKIQKLVDNYNKRYFHRVSYSDALQGNATENSLYQKWHVGLKGDQSITTLLPIKLVWTFASIMNPLLRNGIQTKQDLASLPKKEIASIRNVGQVKTKFILAMRDLAIAEIRGQSSRIN